MTRWHFAILSTGLFALAGVLIFVGLAVVALPIFFLAWGVMATSAWEPMTQLNAPLGVPQNVELEPVPVTSSE